MHSYQGFVRKKNINQSLNNDYTLITLRWKTTMAFKKKNKTEQNLKRPRAT